MRPEKGIEINHVCVGWGEGEDCFRKRNQQVQGRRGKRPLGVEKQIWDWKAGSEVEKVLRHSWRSMQDPDAERPLKPQYNFGVLT